MVQNEKMLSKADELQTSYFHQCMPIVGGPALKAKKIEKLQFYISYDQTYYLQIPPPEIFDFEKYFFISKGEQREVGPLQIPPLKNPEKTFQGGVSVCNRSDILVVPLWEFYFTSPHKRDES